MFQVSIFTAFFNGMITFFSPCVLPLLPLYLSYLAGEAITAEQTKRSKTKLVINTIGFVIGISLLNLLIGFGAKFLSDYIIYNKSIIRIIGGIFMIFFGIYFMSGRQINFLEREKKITLASYSPTFLKSLLLGFTFSLGWSACNGPIVASISMIASFQKDYFRAGLLMLVYSSGFSIPFFITALMAGLLVTKVKKLSPYFGIIKKVSGGILILMGLLMLFDKVQWLNITL